MIDQAGDLEVVAACEDARRAPKCRRRARPGRARDRHPDAADRHRRGHPPRGASCARRTPEVGVVVLSQHAEPLYALELFDPGTERRAYLLKERVQRPDEMHRAVRDVAMGGSVVDPRDRRRAAPGTAARDRRTLAGLTPREHEILAAARRGPQQHAIAAELGLSRSAASRRHINAIFPKLDLRQSTDVNRRVKAALLYLAATDDRSSPASFHPHRTM